MDKFVGAIDDVLEQHSELSASEDGYSNPLLEKALAAMLHIKEESRKEEDMKRAVDIAARVGMLFLKFPKLTFNEAFQGPLERHLKADNNYTADLASFANGVMGELRAVQEAEQQRRAEQAPGERMVGIAGMNPAGMVVHDDIEDMVRAVEAVPQPVRAARPAPAQIARFFQEAAPVRINRG